MSGKMKTCCKICDHLFQVFPEIDRIIVRIYCVFVLLARHGIARYVSLIGNAACACAKWQSIGAGNWTCWVLTFDISFEVFLY